MITGPTDTYTLNKKPIMKLFNEARSPLASLFGKLVLSVNKKNLNRKPKRS